MDNPALSQCGCKQHQIKVLLVGGTQNGKSTLVKSILSYGGHKALSDSVQRGNRNVSQTRHVTTYAAMIGLKSHYLEDGKRNPVDFTSDISPRLMSQLKHRAMPSNRHVHVKLIDTPGLEDSNNFKVAAELFKHRSIAELSAMNIVDEQHKLAIMQAILAEKQIHAVCFVVGKDEPYSKSVQDNIQEYVRIFKASSLSIKYHVVHTAILPGDRVRSALDEREEEFRDTFHIPARHHFVDSDPEPIGVDTYCSHVAINELLESLAKDKPCTVSDVLYPKSDPQAVVDDNLRSTITYMSDAIQTELRLRKTQEAETNEKVTSAEKRRNKCNDQISEVKARIKERDTEDLENILEPQYRESEKSWPWSWSKRKFNIPTRVIIRDYDTSTPDCTWESISGISSSRFEGVLVGPWGGMAKGTVTLKGYRRDVFATELANDREELRNVEKNLKSLEETLVGLRHEIVKLKSQMKELQSKMKALEEDKKRTWGGKLSVRDSKKLCLYFATCNIIGMCLTYKLSQQGNKILLPSSKFSQQSTLFALRKEKSLQQEMLKAAELVITALENDASRKQQTIKDLKEFKTAVLQALLWADDTFQRKPNLRDGLKVSSHLRYISPVNKEIHPLLEALSANLSKRSLILETLVETYNGREVSCLSDLLGRIDQASTEIQQLADANTAEMKVWQVMRQVYQTAVSAASETIQLCESTALPIGPFTIIYNALQKKPPSDVDPYMQLYDETVMAYNIRDNVDDKMLYIASAVADNV
jgi:GTPase SAR1 family protein